MSAPVESPAAPAHAASDPLTDPLPADVTGPTTAPEPALAPEPPVPSPVQAQVSPGAGPVFPVPEAEAAPEAPQGPTSQELADAATPVVPDAPRTEDERLEPEPTGPVTLKSGLQVDVVPMKLRETMKLLKIVTVGAGTFMGPMVNMMNTDDGAEFGRALGALVLMSIPDATEEAVAFVQAMVMPVGMAEMEQPDKVAAMQTLMLELYNPELDDVVSIVERVIRRESEDIRSLGKRIQTAFKMAVKVGDPDAKEVVAAVQS